MYNYDNEYEQRGYETNYEFNPQYESDYEAEAFANESGNEYEMNQEFDSEGFYGANEFEDETGNWQNEIRVHDHRTGARPSTYTTRPAVARPVVVSTRPGFNYARPTSVFTRPIYRVGNAGYLRPVYARAPFYRRWPYNSYNAYRYRNVPWNRGYVPPVYNNYAGSMDPSQQFPQSSGASMPPTPQSGGGVPNYILESIKSLSQQVAATNANVQAMQQSMQQSMSAGSGAPGAMSTPPPPANMPADAGATGTAQPQGNELEMESYEYEADNEMMNNEDANNEMMEMEMAAELLSTNNEMELDNFLESIIGGGLKNLLRTVIKKTLPVAGAAAGSFFGGPLGAQVGAKIGSAASGVFELELEGLSNEDQEFEVAKAVIRLATDAARELEEGMPTGDPNEDAKNALIQSAMRNAPGLLVKKDSRYSDGGSKGRWHRRGNKIVIENAF